MYALSCVYMYVLSCIHARINMYTCTCHCHNLPRIKTEWPLITIPAQAAIRPWQMMIAQQPWHLGRVTFSMGYAEAGRKSPNMSGQCRVTAGSQIL